MIEQTLLNIKPDAVSKNLIGEILRRVEEEKFKIVALKMTKLSQLEAEAFYKVHQDKPFFNPLVEFMISGPCVPVVVEGENVVRRIRTLIGNTDPEQADPGTIRKDFAENERLNAVHASDSVENAVQEINFFFSRKERYYKK